MNKPFKVLATSSLLFMLVACNTNDNVAYNALNPGEDRPMNVSDHRGDNLGDAFRKRNGSYITEGLNTGKGNRDQYGGNNITDRDSAFDTAYNNRRSYNNEFTGSMNDTISADFTTVNSGKYPHTKAIRIQEAKYGYVVVNPQSGQSQQIALPDLQTVTEQYARRFQTQIAQQGQGQGQQQRPTTEKQPAQQQPTPQLPKAQQPTQQAKTPEATQSQPAKPTQPTAGISATEQQVINLTNAERRKAGLKDLVGETKLSSVARTKSTDMQKNGYFSHTSPTYGSPFDMMRDFGVTYSTAGENIAQGQPTAEAVVQAWMNSEGHRKNILNAAYTHIGVGHDTTGNHWTQMFIGK